MTAALPSAAREHTSVGAPKRSPMRLRTKIIAGIAAGALLFGGTVGGVAIANTLIHHDALAQARESIHLLGQAEITVNARTKATEMVLAEARDLSGAALSAATGAAGILPAPELEALSAAGAAISDQVGVYLEAGEVNESEDGALTLTATVPAAPNRFVNTSTHTVELQGTKAAIDRHTKVLTTVVEATESMTTRLDELSGALTDVVSVVAASAPDAAVATNAAHPSASPELHEALGAESARVQELTAPTPADVDSFVAAARAVMAAHTAAETAKALAAAEAENTPTYTDPSTGESRPNPGYNGGGGGSGSGGGGGGGTPNPGGGGGPAAPSPYTWAEANSAIAGRYGANNIHGRCVMTNYGSFTRGGMFAPANPPGTQIGWDGYVDGDTAYVTFYAC